MIYIQKQIGFWDIDSLPDSYLIGTTLEDYENGAFLPLGDEQAAFYLAHPDASQMEVWRMELTPIPETDPTPEPDQLAEDRRQKLQEIADQDAFSNKFFVSVTKGGVEVANKELWLDMNTRTSLYNSSLKAEQGDGKAITELWSDTMPPEKLEVPISWALKNLPLLELYAKRTYNLMQANKALVCAAFTIEEIAQIDVKLNYPLFLTFELNLDL